MAHVTDSELVDAPLGKATTYSDHYDPSLLFALSRQAKRKAIGLSELLPFVGWDIWNAFEFSWLNAKGKPEIALVNIMVPCHSPNIIESKSLKLYLNSFHNTRLSSRHIVLERLTKDLSASVGIAVQVHLLNQVEQGTCKGICLDTQDISCDTYHARPEFLRVEKGGEIEENLYSELLKSNCPVTGQPDWGTVQIYYQGSPIAHDGLLRYLVSLRCQQEFHEQCVEGIFVDIMRQCQPTFLSVYARYTRRGGIDINPYRSNVENVELPDNGRLWRQ